MFSLLRYSSIVVEGKNQSNTREEEGEKANASPERGRLSDFLWADLEERKCKINEGRRELFCWVGQR